MGGDLFLRLCGFPERKNLRDHWANLLCVNQSSDFHKLLRVRLYQDRSSVNLVFIQLRLIRLPSDCNNAASLLNHALGTRERVFANRVEHNIDILRYVLEFLLGIINRHIGAELLQKVLVCG